MLRLRHAEDWRIHEIAEHFDTSQRTVRRRLASAEAPRQRVLRSAAASVELAHAA